jgi:hypothetical protein
VTMAHWIQMDRRPRKFKAAGTPLQATIERSDEAALAFAARLTRSRAPAARSIAASAP